MKSVKSEDYEDQKSGDHEDQPCLGLYVLCIAAILAVLYFAKDPAESKKAAEQLLEKCAQPVDNPFKENFACVSARANR